jgi:capsular polysaccharide biosynthesis protein
MSRSYLFILRRHWLLLVVLTLLGTVLFSSLLLRRPATYSSDATIELGGNPAQALVTQTPNYEDPERRVATEIEILLSPPVATRAAELLDAEGWSINAAAVSQQVTAASQGTSDYIVVSGTATTAHRAQQLTKALVSSYLTYRQQLTHDELTQLQRQLEQRISAAERDLQTLSSSGGAAVPAQRRAIQLRLEGTTQLLETVGLQLSLGTEDVRLLSDAELPRAPAGGTSPVIVGALSVIGATILSVGLILALELLRDQVRTREEAEGLTAAPVLAALPRRTDGADGTARLAPALGAAGGAQTLRLRLQGLAGSDVPGRIIVTSLPKDAQDNVDVSVALATSCGRAGQRVLLIADLDDPTGEGWADQGDADNVVRAAGQPLVQVSGIPGVWLCRATSQAGQNGVLDSASPTRTLDTLSASFDLVILAVSGSDGLEVASVSHLAQFTVMVVGIGRTPGRKVKRFADALRQKTRSLTGVVVVTAEKRRRSTKRKRSVEIAEDDPRRDWSQDTDVPRLLNPSAEEELSPPPHQADEITGHPSPT